MSNRPQIDEKTRRRWRRHQFPRVLITGGSSRLAGALVEGLHDSHNIVLMDDAPLQDSEDVDTISGSLLDEDLVWKAVRDLQAVVHIAQPPGEMPPEGPERDHLLLDLAGRGTHVLFSAAVDVGVKQFVCVSSLDMFSPYPEDVYISEEWKPLPSSDIVQTAPYLTESVAREFARDHAVTVTCLRLGTLADADTSTEAASDLSAVDPRDAAQAVSRALERDSSDNLNWTRRWAIYHIAADHPNPRFLISRAKQRLGYKPAHSFDPPWASE